MGYLVYQVFDWDSWRPLAVYQTLEAAWARVDVENAKPLEYLRINGEDRPIGHAWLIPDPIEIL